MQELAKFIEIVIGDEQGAKEIYFRFENMAHALPPPGKYKVDEMIINYGNFPLRLYCLRVSEKLVILFNGDEKTSKNAQDGKTRTDFYNANQFAKRIIEAFNDETIYVSPDGRTIRNFDNSNTINL